MLGKYEIVETDSWTVAYKACPWAVEIVPYNGRYHCFSDSRDVAEFLSKYKIGE